MDRDEYLDKLGPLLAEQKKWFRKIGKKEPTPEQLEALRKNMDEKCQLLSRYRVKED